MRYVSIQRGLTAALWTFGLTAAADARPATPAQRCPNCEATVTLDAAGAQRFADVLMIINSMPLHGIILDRGGAGGTAQVVVATDPEYAARNGLTSFDVAKKAVDLAADGSYGIRAVAATWAAPRR